VYRISEPLIAFYHAIMRPEWSRLERRGQAAQDWRDSAHRFTTAVLGSRFEQVCRDWTQAYAPPEVNGIPVSQVGSGLVNDPGNRRSRPVTRILWPGEAKPSLMKLEKLIHEPVIQILAGQPGHELLHDKADVIHVQHRLGGYRPDRRRLDSPPRMRPTNS
jgi:hypothetical protein